MNTALEVSALVAGVALSGVTLYIVFCFIFSILALLVLFWWKQVSLPLTLSRLPQNPILEPDPAHYWESEAVFNPAALYAGGRVHLIYRALGMDGVSRFGYASSPDGIHFDERLPYPVFELRTPLPTRHHFGPLTYHPGLYASGGGWGGSEDPRMVEIESRVYLSFTAFEGWHSARIGLTSLSLTDFLKRFWQWRVPALISPPGEVHKNWVIFPEKINGKYAVLHSVTPQIAIEYLDNLDMLEEPDVYIQSPGRSGGREEHWDKAVRGAGAPPVKTPEGWLLFYHAYDPAQSHIGYKVGAMLLDLEDPSIVLHRASAPVLEPKEWYEHDRKPHVIVLTGAVVVGENLIVYYGGGDKRIAAASANLKDFLRMLASGEHAVLEPVTV